MRQVWILLMLYCTALGAWAQCPPTGTRPASLQAGHAATDQTTTPVAAPGPESAPNAVKVSAIAQTPRPAPLAAKSESGWREHRLGAPLLVSALIMLVIALRRGRQ